MADIVRAHGEAFQRTHTLTPEQHAVLRDIARCRTAELGRDPRWLGADLGVTSVLPTWRRDLRFPPHVHCIVTGGGLSLDGTRWIEAGPTFLFPVRVFGALFRGKMLAALRRAHDRGELRFTGAAAPLADRARFRRLCDKLYRKRWVVSCKPPFGSPEHVYRSLDRSAHRTGISHHRLLSLDPRGVTFHTRHGAPVPLAPDEFLRRFLLHVLPRGFVKIRHHGLFAPGHIATKLAAARALLPAAPATPTVPPSAAPRDFREFLLALTGLDLRRCRVCGSLSVLRCPCLSAPWPPPAPRLPPAPHDRRPRPRSRLLPAPLWPPRGPRPPPPRRGQGACASSRGADPCPHCLPALRPPRHPPARAPKPPPPAGRCDHFLHRASLRRPVCYRGTASSNVTFAPNAQAALGRVRANAY